ncbi:MAG: hypothetical protein H7240_09805 [Glaciimonas sp.]|nr:hypothetical protein [Glaciimonas sp.]
MNIAAYNSGYVASSATIAYLGANKRIVSADAALMIHETTVGTSNVGNAAKLKVIAD